MKTPETFPQPRKHSVLAWFSKAGVRFIATACAAIAVCFALTSHATNILVNPGFDAIPGFTGWSAHTTETWNIATHTDQYISAPNDLWMQGLYGNGGASLSSYVTYAYQTFSTTPGNTYTADAHFSQYVLFFGVAGTPTEGGDDLTANTSPTGASGLFGNNDATSGYYEDGWVEVAFLDASSNILADYRSIIINPAFVQSLTNNPSDITSQVVPSVNTNYPPPAMVTNVYLNWMDVQVTNQYKPSTLVPNTDPDPLNPYFPGTAQITNTLGAGQVMVAPAGAVKIIFALCVCQTSYASGAPHWDDCSLNQVSGFQPDVISGVTPSSGVMLTNTSLTFNVQSPVGTTTATNGIKVVVNTTPANSTGLPTGGVDESSSLVFSGNSANWNVTLPGFTTPNNVYTISISATNSAGLVATASSRFDTFSPTNFVVECEDYDYNGGQYIQNPIPTNNTAATSYWGRSGIPGTDYDIFSGGVAGGGNNLQPNYPNRGTNTDAAWQIPNDPELPLYVAQSNNAIYNVTIAYNNPGNWYEYTRNYPTGNYIIYARMSAGNGAGSQEYLNRLTGGNGTPTQTTTNVGTFLFNNNDYTSYYWVPLQDANGNTLIVSLPGGPQTLQLVSGTPTAGCNVSYFMFAPLPPNGLPPDIKNLNPALNTGGNVFVTTNKLTFTVSSYNNTIATSDIHTYLNGTDVSASETFTGYNTNWAVSVPLSLPANQVNQTFGISAKDSKGNTNGVSGSFDTFSQNNYMIEAEDFDFNGGQFIDNPFPTAPLYVAVNSYGVAPAGNQANLSVLGVDVTTTNVTTAETYLYRIYDNNVGTEVTSDYLRSKFYNISGGNGEPANTTNSDYDVGWWPPGTWLNYTRTFPTGTYNVWGRLASGGAYTNATLSLVTTGQQLGTFADPNANGFQNWHWVEMMSNGAPAVVTLGGVEKLKVTAPPGNATGSLNANFYMFVATVPAPVLTVSRTASTLSITFATYTGNTYIVQWTGSLSGTPTWTTLTTISGDGSNHTATDTVGASPRFYRVEVTTP